MNVERRKRWHFFACHIQGYGWGIRWGATEEEARMGGVVMLSSNCHALIYGALEEAREAADKLNAIEAAWYS